MQSDHSLCEFCGAYSPRSCDMRDEAGFCQLEEIENADPDRMREDRDERRRLEQED